jgi:hypothetical protein
VLLVAALAAAVFAMTVGHPFVWDDAYNVVDNVAIRDLAHVPGFFTEAWGAQAAEAMNRAINANYWRPVALTSYAVDYALFGLSPVAFHATNVLIHAGVTVLVLLLGWRLARPASPRELRAVVLGACLFAVHPIHTEVVAVITYRTDLLAALLYAAGLVLWLGTPERALGATRRARWVWVPLCYAAGLASKEMAVTLPLAIGVMELLGLPPQATRTRLWRRLLPLGPSAAVLVGYLLLRAALLEPPAYTYFGDAPGAVVAWTMLGVLGLYVRLLVAPWPLNPFYDWSVLPLRQGPGDAVVILGALALAAWLVAGVVAWRRGHAGLAFGLALFLVVLVPVSQIVPVVVAAAERFLYLASAGPLIAVPVAAARWLGRARPTALRPLAALGAVAVLLLGGLTLLRSHDWRSDRAILEANVRDWPESYNAWYGLARLAEREGRRDEAARIYRRLGRDDDARRVAP